MMLFKDQPWHTLTESGWGLSRVIRGPQIWASGYCWWETTCRTACCQEEQDVAETTLLCNIWRCIVWPSTLTLSQCTSRLRKPCDLEGTIVDDEVMEEWWYFFLPSVWCCAQQLSEIVAPCFHPLLRNVSPTCPSLVLFHLVILSMTFHASPYCFCSLDSMRPPHQVLPIDPAIGTKEKLFGLIHRTPWPASSRRRFAIWSVLCASHERKSERTIERWWNAIEHSWISTWYTVQLV